MSLFSQRTVLHSDRMLFVRLRLLILHALAFVLFSSTNTFARDIQITILHTTDWHAQIEPLSKYETGGNVGGILKLAKLIRIEREEDPAAILLDNGDTIQGSPYGFFSDGEIPVNVLNELQYDAWNLGNHEFDWGIEKLSNCLALVKATPLGANIVVPEKTLTTHKGLSKIKPYTILTRKGLSIAVIGLTTPGIPNWILPNFLEGISFSPSVSTLKPILEIPEVQQADMRILMAHQGLLKEDNFGNEINAIAAAYPQLHLIIGGHTHQRVPDIRAGQTIFTQAGYHGGDLGVAKIWYDPSKKIVTRSGSSLIPVEPHTEIESNLEAKISPAITTLDKAVLARPVGEAISAFPAPSECQGIMPGPIVEMLCSSIAESLEVEGLRADAILHGALDSQAGLASGPIRQRDIFRIVPYENFMGVFQIQAAQFKPILEEGLNAMSNRMLWGLKCSLSRDPSGQAKVDALYRQDGTPLPDEEIITVACNSYDLASAGLRFPKLRDYATSQDAHLRLSRKQVRSALIEWLGKHNPASPTVVSWMWWTNPSDAVVPTQSVKPSPTKSPVIKRPRSPGTKH